jgi:hypothetical protein
MTKTLALLAALAVPLQEKAELAFKTLDDFESYGSDEALREAYKEFEDETPVPRSVSHDVKGGGKQAMKFEGVAANAEGREEWTSLSRELPDELRDWSGWQGVQFWVKNASKEELYLEFDFEETGEVPWAFKKKFTVWLAKPGGGFEKKEFEGEGLELEAGAEFTVRVPFSMFAIPDWHEGDKTAKMDLTSIATCWFGVNPLEIKGGPVYIDDLKLYKQK